MKINDKLNNENITMTRKIFFAESGFLLKLEVSPTSWLTNVKDPITKYEEGYTIKLNDDIDGEGDDLSDVLTDMTREQLTELVKDLQSLLDFTDTEIK